MVTRFTQSVKIGDKLVPVTRQKSHGGYRYNKGSYYGSSDHNQLKPINIEKYSGLSLFVRNEPKEGEYKYLIRNQYGNGVEAFYTEAGLNKFLKRTGLRKVFTDEYATGKNYQLEGSFERIYLSGNYKLLNAFGIKHNLTRTKIISNGEYTTGYYDGKGKIYLLNPNYPRTIYNHFWE